MAMRFCCPSLCLLLLLTISGLSWGQDYYTHWTHNSGSTWIEGDFGQYMALWCDEGDTPVFSQPPSGSVPNAGYNCEGSGREVADDFILPYGSSGGELREIDLYVATSEVIPPSPSTVWQLYIRDSGSNPGAVLFSVPNDHISSVTYTDTGHSVGALQTVWQAHIVISSYCPYLFPDTQYWLSIHAENPSGTLHWIGLNGCTAIQRSTWGAIKAEF